MEQDDSKFYEQMTTFSQFDDYCSTAPYFTVPESWWILLADIRGSTRAIQEGRYQDVNLAGAATIAAVINATKGTELPFVFGGDGATILVPQNLLEDAKEALVRTNGFIQSLYQLEMRIAAIPVRDLTFRDSKIQVAKYVLSPGNTLAFFRGGGLALADELLKSNRDYLVKQPEGDVPFPDLVGLTCRWKPLIAKHGTMLTLLVKARNQEDSQRAYAEVSHGLRSILSFTPDENSPISELQFEPSWPALKSLKLEAHWSSRKLGIFKSFVAKVKNFFFTLVLFYFDKTEKNVGRYDPVKYKKEMVTNADFRKFDDMLRMVVDCSAEQATETEAFLTRLQGEGKIHFGAHRSPQALMTCLVASWVESQHVHFIDGSDGGYAMAALQLKAHIKATA